MRVGQLSTIAGAIGLLSMSESDWVAKTTEAFFLRKRLQPFAQLTRESGIVEDEPALVDDEQGRPSVEALLDAMEKIGEHGCGARRRR